MTPSPMSRSFPRYWFNNPHPLCFLVKVRQEIKPSHSASRYNSSKCTYTSLSRQWNLNICLSVNCRHLQTTRSWLAITLQIQFEPLWNLQFLFLYHSVSSLLRHNVLLSTAIMTRILPEGSTKFTLSVFWSFWVTLVGAECRRGLLLSTLTEKGEVKFTATNTDAYRQLFFTCCVQLSAKFVSPNSILKCSFAFCAAQQLYPHNSPDSKVIGKQNYSGNKERN